MPVMYYDDRIPSVNIRGKLFFWDYISVLNSNLCTHCTLTKPFYLYTLAAHTESLLAVWTAWWSGAVLGVVEMLLSLGESVGGKGCIWTEGCSFAPVPQCFLVIERTVASLQLWFLLCLLERTAGLTGNSQEPNMPEIGTSQEFLEYRHPVSVPSHCSFQVSKPPRIQFDPQS